MIQRIQSIYLLLGAASAGSIYCLEDLWTGPSAVISPWFTPVSLGLFGLVVAGAVIAIFLYTDRAKQRRVVQLVQIITALGLVSVFVGEYIGESLPFVGAENAGSVAWLSLGMPVIGYIFFFLARRGIDKDIRLIQSMDRLR